MALSTSFRVGRLLRCSSPRCPSGFRFHSNKAASELEHPEVSVPITVFEPSEVSVDERALLSRQAGLLFDEKSDGKSRGQAIVGGSLAAAGVGVLGFAHTDLWLTLDAAGCTLAVAGAAVFATSGAIPWWSESKMDHGPSRFEFKLLNDGALLAADLKAIEQLSRGSELVARLPETTQELVNKHNDREETEKKAWVMQEQERITAAISEDLAAGMTVHRLKQKLQPKTFVLEFDVTKAAAMQPGGTMKLISRFTESITLMLATASPFDEVVIKLTSPGGAVTDYGLASSQLLRLKRAGIKTTVCVDTVAASGGYMMACVADTLVASPFAFLGSIGVVAGMPNISKVLQKNDVDYLLFTAGKFKRTVTALTEVTDEDKAKFQDQLEDIHQAFSQHVDSNRGEAVDVDEVATGEAWLAMQAMEKGLVDQLMTSDEYLRSRMPHSDVIAVSPKKKKKSLREMLSGGVADARSTVNAVLEGVGLGNAAGVRVPGVKFEDTSGLASIHSRS